jgi:hypothetical protein
MVKLKMIWVDHAARMVEMRYAHRIVVGRPEGKRPIGRLSVDGRIILKWVLK